MLRGIILTKTKKEIEKKREELDEMMANLTDPAYGISIDAQRFILDWVLERDQT